MSIIPLLLSTTLFMVLLLAAPRECPAFRNVDIGDAPKPFSLTTLNGERLVLFESLGDKITVLFFWAAWSPRSHEALSDYQNLFSEYKNDGLQVLGINVEHEELTTYDRQVINDSIIGSKVKFPILLDEGLNVFSEYGVSAIPSTILMDSTGKVVELLPGYAPNLRDEFKDRVIQVLGLYVESAKAEEREEKYKPKGKAARYYIMAKLFAKKGMKGKGIKALRKALDEDADYQDAIKLLQELESN